GARHVQVPRIPRRAHMLIGAPGAVGEFDRMGLAQHDHAGIRQHMGTPWNPWDLDVPRTPGGSSSGTGVAVAARMAPAGLGTDTGGSVRIPAAWCGITGLKTSVGRISTHGVLPLSPTLDTPGPLARSVEDCALL